MLRATSLGISVADLHLITLGELFDILYEQSLDYEENEQEKSVDATQKDFDIF